MEQFNECSIRKRQIYDNEIREIMGKINSSDYKKVERPNEIILFLRAHGTDITNKNIPPELSEFVKITGSGTGNIMCKLKEHTSNLFDALTSTNLLNIQFKDRKALIEKNISKLSCDRKMTNAQVENFCKTRELIPECYDYRNERIKTYTPKTDHLYLIPKPHTKAFGELFGVLESSVQADKSHTISYQYRRLRKLKLARGNFNSRSTHIELIDSLIPFDLFKSEYWKNKIKINTYSYDSAYDYISLFQLLGILKSIGYINIHIISFSCRVMQRYDHPHGFSVLPKEVMLSVRPRLHQNESSVNNYNQRFVNNHRLSAAAEVPPSNNYGLRLLSNTASKQPIIQPHNKMSRLLNAFKKTNNSKEPQPKRSRRNNNNKSRNN